MSQHDAQDGLLRLQQQFGFTLPERSAHNWRLRDACGSVPSLNIPCRLLATDGLLAIAVRGDGRTLLEIHLAAFVPDEKKPMFFAKRKKSAGAKLRQASAKRLQEVLDWI